MESLFLSVSDSLDFEKVVEIEQGQRLFDDDDDGSDVEVSQGQGLDDDATDDETFFMTRKKNDSDLSLGFAFASISGFPVTSPS